MGFLQRLAILSIPATYLVAGMGMLLLLTVKNAEGTFFERIQSHESEWIIAHIVLLFSTVFIIPGAIALRGMIHHRWASILGDACAVVLVPSTLLLAGQYAIDFVMPLIAEVGGDAYEVHGLLFDTALINTLFYGLPNLVFLALFLLTIALIWCNAVPKSIAIILLVNWTAVILGNLVDPLFQRLALLLLAFSFLPVVISSWRK